jgi:GLPGLI family protein
MRTCGINYFWAFLFTGFSFTGFSQITSGKIIFERKTNLQKKYKDAEGGGGWLKNLKSPKIDMFELYFNDSISVFRPVESDLKEEMDWATMKNTVYQDHSNNTRISVLNVWGQKIYIKDSTVNRTWKVTESKRKIGKYECRKALWQPNDSTRIYAWFSEEILPSTGPETFTGLPGAILGLATEDGGVVYFAKSVEILNPDFEKIIPSTGKNKLFTEQELKTKLEKDFGNQKWGKTMLTELFMW